MATSGPILAHRALKQRSHYYKSELMARMFGVSASAAVGAEEVLLTNTVMDISDIPAHSNLVGIGYGVKVANGLGVEGEAVRVYVRTKLPRSGLSSYELIPSHIDGLTTDVIPVGDIIAARQTVSCGVSVGHPSVTAGTLGCLVRRPELNEYYVLSNNHVLANCDGASIGDPILQPGTVDGGDPNDPLAELTEFEPIMTPGIKTIDAAIAKILQPNSVVPEIQVIGRAESPMLPAVYQSVRKFGRTTSHTLGIVMGIDEDVSVRYGKVVIAFNGQIAIDGFRSPFSAGGDSGSLIVDAVSRSAVGLLFATAANGTTFANEIQPVLDRFGVEVI